MRISFLTAAIFLLLSQLCSTANGQSLFTISLERFSINKDSIPFKIAEVVDGRRDKKVIGIIQLGLNNRKEIAVFEKPGLQEIENLFQRSGLISRETGFVLRVSKLFISEITQTWKETAKAELAVDFFIPYQGRYYHLTSIYTTVEPNGLDVTQTHGANIVSVVEKSLAQLASGLNSMDEAKSYTRENLDDPQFSFRDIDSMPIIQTDQYKDGYYTTFDEFLNNAPSLDITCKAKLGAKPKIKCGDKEESINLYGYAKDNQLYVLFHQRFYPLEKTDNGFFFRGPDEISPRVTSDMTTGWIAAGALGGGLAASSHKYQALYYIDLRDGSIKNRTGF